MPSCCHTVCHQQGKGRLRFLRLIFLYVFLSEQATERDSSYSHNATTRCSPLIPDKQPGRGRQRTENENADVKREEDDHTRTGYYDNERIRDARRGTATLSDNDVERTTQNTNYEKRTPRTLTPTTTELPRSSPCHDFLQWYLTFRIRSQCDKRMFYRMWITTGSNEEHAVLSWSVFGSSNLIF